MFIIDASKCELSQVARLVDQGILEKAGLRVLKFSGIFYHQLKIMQVSLHKCVSVIADGISV